MTTAELLMECDILGALGEASRHLPQATYERLHAAVYALAARVEQSPMQGWGEGLSGPVDRIKP